MKSHCLAGMSLLAACTINAAASAQTYEYEFVLLEALSDFGIPECYVNDINNNNIAIGTTTYEGFYRSFTWTEADGMAVLPSNGASNIDDQNRILFGGYLLDAVTGETLFEFTGLPGSLRSVNASMIGVGHTPSGGPGCEPFDCPYDCADPFTWTESGGAEMTTFLPGLKAWEVINDSNLVIGQSVWTCDDEQAIVWQYGEPTWINLSDLLPPLDFIGRDAQTTVAGLSQSGHVIGKALYGSEPEQCFIWTQQDGFTFLPTIPGGELGYQWINDVNNDGHVVGDALDFTTMDWNAYVWDAQRGIRNLNALADTNGYSLRAAVAINDNGWIVGYCAPDGVWGPPRGFILKPIEQDPAIPGDVDGNGVVDVFDLLDLLGAWGACGGAVCPADLDSSGSVDVFDLLELLANWG